MNNQQVAHAWAHGQAAKGSNFKSDGVTLTSYYTTIAAKIDDVFYISSNNMSPSTGRHISYARQALGWDKPNIFYTSAFSWSGSNPALTHEAMIQPAARSAVSSLEYALANSRTRKKTKLNAIQEYIQERERITTHAAKYHVSVIMPEMTAGPEAIAEYQAALAAAEEKKEAACLKAQKKQQKEDKAQYKAWLTAGAGRCPASFITRGADQITIVKRNTGKFNHISEYGKVPIFEDVVITSQGAECPLDHAIKALKFWQSLKPGEGFQTNGKVIHLGMFKLDSIDPATHDVKAGCHTFTAAEIQRFIAQWRGRF